MIVHLKIQFYKKGGIQMSDEIFNMFSAVGIGLTFLASMAAVIVSIISLRCSNKVGVSKYNYCKS